MSARLDAVRAAARAYERASRDLRAAVAAAASGESGEAEGIASIATAAGVTRQTVYRWMAMETGSGGDSVPLVRTLDDALALMAAITTSPSAAETIPRRIGGGVSIEAKLLGLRIGASNMPPVRALSEDERAIIFLGTGAAAAAERYHERYGKWPYRVYVGGVGTGLGPGGGEGDDAIEDDEEEMGA